MSSKLGRPDTARDAAQATQRVRVGMIGLAAVLLLIGLAAAIFTTANRDRQGITAVGAANEQVVANLVVTNGMDLPPGTKEPLAELGVAPSADGNDSAPAAHRSPTPLR